MGDSSRSEGFALTGYDIHGCVEDGIGWGLDAPGKFFRRRRRRRRRPPGVGRGGGGETSAFPPKSNHAPGGVHDLIS